jgi:hypothetical protein
VNTTSNQKTGSIISAMLWMCFISLLLFWLPLFGPLLAGIVGGKKAGTIGAAVLAVFLPALLLAAILFFITTFLSGQVIFGFMAGLSSFFLSAVNIGPLLLGAIIGGALNTQ